MNNINFTSQKQSITEYIKEYNTQLDDLEEALGKDAKKVKHLLSEASLSKRLNDLLVLRDKIVSTENVLSQAHKLETLDDRLFSIGCDVLSQEQINMAAWRTSRGDNKKTMGWWWRLDTATHQDTGRIHYPTTVRTIFWVLLSLFLLYSASFDIARTVSTITALVNRIIGDQNVSAIGVDIVTIVGVIGQVAINGRIAITFADRIADGLNYTLNRLIKGYWRIFYVFPLPINRVFVATIVFWLITAVVGRFILPKLGDAMGTQAIVGVQSDLGQSKKNLEIAGLLNPSSNYSKQLTLLGIQYEEVNDLTKAEEIYQKTLQTDSTFIIARLRLAEIYISKNMNQEAITLLDDGLWQTDPRSNLNIGKQLSTPRQIDQLKYLLLVSRGHAFLSANIPSGAIQDLCDAEYLIKEQSPVCPQPEEKGELAADLFITTLTKDHPNENALPTGELYYYLAKSYESQAQNSSLSDDRTLYEIQANKAWLKVSTLARPEIGRERIWIIQANDHIRQN